MEGRLPSTNNDAEYRPLSRPRPTRTRLGVLRIEEESIEQGESGPSQSSPTFVNLVQHGLGDNTVDSKYRVEANSRRFSERETLEQDRGRAPEVLLYTLFRHVPGPTPVL